VDRATLAEQILSRTAYPERAKQGGHQTCNVSSVEERTYATQPSAAARLVTDVALTGQYTAPDGTHVKVDPKQDAESQKAYFGYGQREQASQIFQVAAVNVFYAKQNAQTGKDLHYEEVKPEGPGDTGERIMDYSKNPPEVVSKKGPNLTQPDEAAILASITGRSDKGVFLQTDDHGDQLPGHSSITDQTTVIKSEQDLVKALSDAKASGNLPLIVRVYPQNEPFSSAMGADPITGSKSSHSISIVGYDAGPPPTVKYDNPATASSATDKMSVHDLFRSMHTPQESSEILQADVQAGKDAGKVDHAKEIELLGLQKSVGKISDAQYEQGLHDIINELGKNSGSFLSNNPQANQIRDELSTAVQRQSPEAQARLLSEEHQLGMLGQGSSNDSNYAKLLGDVGEKIAKMKEEGGWTDWLSNRSAAKEFKKALATLPPDLQKEILQHIGKQLGID
jgi:hypothetical protein